MKRFKFTATIAMLVLIVCILGFGVYAVLTPFSGISNNTEFISGDDNVFVKIYATYSGPALSTAGATDTYYYELDRADREAYENDQIDITPWHLGTTNFTFQEKVITLTFEIENLNDVNKMNVEFRNLAYDSDQKFSTQYSCASTLDGLEGSGVEILNVPDTNGTVFLPILTIEPGEKLCVRLIYTLLVFNESFSFENDIKITFSTVVEPN